MNVYTEVLTWILCSHKENFELLNREDDNSAVIIGKPRGADFEVPLQNLFSHIHIYSLAIFMHPLGYLLTFPLFD